MAEKTTEKDAPVNVPEAIKYRSIKDIVADLSKPVAARHLSKKKQGGKDIYYLSWHDAARYMDLYAPGWNYEVRSIQSIAGKVILTTRVSIPCAEGVVFREATGQEDETKDSWGDSTSNSESMSFRRACAKFGLGLYLYDEEGYKLSLNPSPAAKTNGQGNGKSEEKPEAQSKPVETKPAPETETGDAITEKQLHALINLCDNHKPPLDKTKIALHYSGNRTELLEDLTESEAATAIAEVPKLKDSEKKR